MDPTAIVPIIVDVAKGKLIEVALEPVVRPIWEVLKKVTYPGWDRARREVQLNLQQATDEYRQKGKDAAEQLARTIDEGEAGALVCALLRAAAQATTEDRLKMLAAAAAGVLTPDLSAETRSRVARVLEQLEPSDVGALRKVADSTADDPGFRFIGLPRESATRAVLLQTGCVILEAGGVGLAEAVRITDLGRAVLLALRRWQPGCVGGGA
jgi:hypothetical protein